MEDRRSDGILDFDMGEEVLDGNVEDVTDVDDDKAEDTEDTDEDTEATDEDQDTEEEADKPTSKLAPSLINLLPYTILFYLLMINLTF